MKNYSLVHVSDAVLLRDLSNMVGQERLATADLLVHIAEVDARELYVRAGYSSMHMYCVEELRLSDDAAFRRIRAARAGRKFPALLEALAAGRLHLAAVSLLAPHVTSENVEELIRLATHRRKSEIEASLARRFPVPERPAILRPIYVRTSNRSLLVPGRVATEVSMSSSETRAPEHPDAAKPPALECFLLQVTIAKSTRDKLRHLQALLSHAIPTGDVAQVLDRALDVAIEYHEKRKAGSGEAVPSQAPCARRCSIRRDQRYVPAHVRRAVWERDRGQCTFVSSAGRRCTATRFLEFDHMDPVARGGRATVDRMRLRCRAHNQYEAERVFGVDFMRQRRQQARASATQAPASSACRKQDQHVVRIRSVADGS
jgi:hypothetical protein